MLVSPRRSGSSVIRRRTLAGAWLPLVLVLASAFAGCDEGESVQVFAASSLQDVLPDLLDAYAERNADVNFELQYGGSQALATQIELGAEADLFISANEQQIARLDEQNLIERRVAMALNSLVIAVGAGSALNSVEDLGGSDVRVALGAPEVPVGALTERFLERLEPRLAEAIRENVITEDPNVRIVLSRVELGEADAAFVYRTDLVGLAGLRAIEIAGELELNVYVGGTLEGSAAEAGRFLDFLAGHEAASIWEAAGFQPLNATARVR